jgi:hypothetical protein
LSHVFLTIDFMDGTESIEATGVWWNWHRQNGNLIVVRL